MKAHERIRCPKCGEDTILREKVKLEGWKRIGSVLCCSFCQAELGEPDEALESTAPQAAGTDALSALLGENLPAVDPAQLLGEAAENHFCRDCAHYLNHAFLSRCFLTGHDVNPMDDCPQFEPKKVLS